ncbi:MAG: hypothetical protein A3A97_00110 [Candidatus Terrybacteria bacterium RIFCSPLOWO2_01_FULL_40_23]|uniref:Antitoxin Xre/MbcA/ParS-like toxin-binding domain-containing protein n=1 Tax=Candidatus Terrybacteria bacterium RIFCSPLOWO2_01_FULL_40_23 TaxID=1802366 RepID=A0A1G2PU01_9BACT|nr:MAG: hypothetical protein UT82_C0009G0026 [Parcubacteria group bacterium GW2011_GWB1_40_14]OHA51820.1 MAG: hypothetical protein A3A97_00110 [Candidatus Terrybacteria bacterium RIFCSPLOWO2_01_FULL_40_23]
MSVNVAVWDAVQDTLGVDITAALITGQARICKARAKFFEYDADPQNAPVEVIKRFNFVTKIVFLLEGSYNDFGIQRWFLRKRAQLDDASPLEILKGDWDPQDPEPQKVLKLAKETYGGQSAT